MSVHRPVEVTCPRCEATGNYTMWESINRDLDPAAASELAHGRLLLHRCAGCGAETPVVYPLLLNAMLEREMVQLADEDGPAPDLGPAAAVLRALGDWVLWMVSSPDALMECARLFEAGLDRFAMLLLHEGLSRELERDGQRQVEAMLFDSMDTRMDAPRLVFAVFFAGSEGPEWVTFGHAEWEQHAGLVGPFRARCIPAGQWTPWSRATAVAALALISADATDSP